MNTKSKDKSNRDVEKTRAWRKLDHKEIAKHRHKKLLHGYIERDGDQRLI